MTDRDPRPLASFALSINSARVLAGVALILVVEAMPDPSGVDSAAPALPEVTVQWSSYAGGTIIADPGQISIMVPDQATPILPPPESER